MFLFYLQKKTKMDLGYDANKITDCVAHAAVSKDHFSKHDCDAEIKKYCNKEGVFACLTLRMTIASVRKESNEEANK